MRASPSDLSLRGWALVALLGSTAALPATLRAAAPQSGAQQPTIVSKAVSFGTNEAGLRIGLADGSEVEIRFDQGTVLIDGEAVGSYTLDGELEGTWRALVTQAVQLDDGPLREALVAWEPSEGLEADALDVAQRIDARLETALSVEVAAIEVADAPTTVDGETLSSLFSRVDVLGDLGALLGEVDVDDVRIVVGDDLEVSRDMVLEGSVLVIDGDVEVAGRIRGDLLVVDGDIELLDGGLIEGDLRYVDGYLDFEGGEVRGSVREIAGRAVVVDADIRKEIAEQIRADLEIEALAPAAPRSRSVGIFSRLGRAIEGLFETVLTIFVLGIFGVMVSFFAGKNVDRVAEVARRTPGRAAAVGVSAAFLSVPIWIIGIIGLAITIIGIPALIAWVPGFPILVALAGALGYVAVARNVGTWLTHQNIPGFDWVRVTRPNSLIFGGVAVLLAPFAVAHTLQIVPFFGGFRELAAFVGVMAGLMSTAVGFGAVLMTRGGKHAEYGGDDWYADLQDLGADLGDLRGFASGFGRRWTGPESSEGHAAEEMDAADPEVSEPDEQNEPDESSEQDDQDDTKPSK